MKESELHPTALAHFHELQVRPAHAGFLFHRINALMR